MLTSQVLPLVIGIACLVLILGLLKRWLGAPGPLPYFSRVALLSDGELAFYQALRRALPQHVIICPKVRLADVINCSGEDWKQGFGGRISQKHLDFVIADSDSTAIVLAIELDDKSHRRADRRQRDEFLDRALSAANIPLVRVPCAPVYDAKTLRAVLTQKMEVAAPVPVK